MAHRASGGARQPLQIFGGHHHHRDPGIAPAAAEVGGQVCGRPQVGLACGALRCLQHHMAAGNLLGVEPEVAAAGLPQADPLVLAMVAAHLQPQAGGRAHFEGYRLALGLAGGGLAPLGAGGQCWLATRQLVQLVGQVGQLLAGLRLLKKGEAGFDPGQSLLVQLQPRHDRRR